MKLHIRRCLCMVLCLSMFLSVGVFAVGGGSSTTLQKLAPEQKLKTMTLEEKVAQMFMITPEALTGVPTATAAGQTTQRAIQQYPIGGLIYFSQNLKNPKQVKTMIANTQKYSKERIGLPMFINVDEEGGMVTRFGRNPNFSLGNVGNMRAIGDTKNSQKAYAVGTKIGGFLYELGFNMDSAPVADVLSNPNNQVIGSRSFGATGKRVSRMALQEWKGLKDQNVIGVYKHFPGHGATAADTHQGYAYTNRTLDKMMKRELLPFRTGIQNGVQVIMVAHIACPKVTGNNTPASLSPIMIKRVLRKQMGYDGIVMTDGLDMGAITAQYSSKQAAVAAVHAGADILLMPKNFKEAYQGVLNAVKNGKISEKRIDKSVLRILKLKQQSCE